MDSSINNQKELTDKIKEVVYGRLDLSKDIEDDKIREIIEECVLEESRQKYISIKDREILSKQIFNSIRKLDILQELLEDDSVTEIMVNGRTDIFYEKEGRLL